MTRLTSLPDRQFARGRMCSNWKMRRSEPFSTNELKRMRRRIRL